MDEKVRLTITMRDDDTKIESRTFIEVFEDSTHAITAEVAKACKRLLADLGYIDGRKEGEEGLGSRSRFDDEHSEI